MNTQHEHVKPSELWLRGLPARAPVRALRRTRGGASVNMLDLCSGLGGASQAMRERGWTVTTVDIDSQFSPDVLTDIRNWHYSGPQLDFVWASPPCAEFSRTDMPWIKNAPEPDLSIMRACLRIIRETKPRYWALENVRGAIKWFRPLMGNPTFSHHPWFVWGTFPPVSVVIRQRRQKQSYSSTQAAQRAMIPYELSLAFAQAIEMQGALWQAVPA